MIRALHEKVCLQKLHNTWRVSFIFYIYVQYKRLNPESLLRWTSSLNILSCLVCTFVICLPWTWCFAPGVVSCSGSPRGRSPPVKPMIRLLFWSGYQRSMFVSDAQSQPGEKTFLLNINPNIYLYTSSTLCARSHWFVRESNMTTPEGVVASNSWLL